MVMQQELEEIIEDSDVLETIGAPIEDTTQQQRYEQMCSQVYAQLAHYNNQLKKTIITSKKATKKTYKKIKKQKEYKELQKRIQLCRKTGNSEEAQQLQQICAKRIGTMNSLQQEYIAHHMKSHIPGQSAAIDALMSEGKIRDFKATLPLYKEKIFTNIGVAEHERDILSKAFDYAVNLESTRSEKKYIGSAAPLISGTLGMSVAIAIPLYLSLPLLLGITMPLATVGGIAGGISIGNYSHNKKQAKMAQQLFEGKKHEYVDELMKLEQW